MKILQVAPAEPAYMRPENACRYTGLPRAIVDQGIADGHVKAFWLRNRYRKTERAMQLIDRLSLLFYIENFTTLYPDEAAILAQLSRRVTEVSAREAAAR